MNPSELSKFDLEREYEAVLNKVSKQDLEVFAYYHQKELLAQIIHASNTETHNLKAVHQFLDTLPNFKQNYKFEGE